MQKERPAAVAPPGWTPVCVAEGETGPRISSPVPRQGPCGSRVRRWSHSPPPVCRAWPGCQEPRRTAHRLVTVPSLGGCVPWLLHYAVLPPCPSPAVDAVRPETRAATAAPTSGPGPLVPHIRLAHAPAAATHPLCTQSRTQGAGPQARRFPKGAHPARTPIQRPWWSDAGGRG